MTNWFKMMNIKDSFSAIRFRDDHRSPWTLDCNSFNKLNKYCDIVATCTWTGGRGRVQKLTKPTGNAFITSTKFNMEAATFLLTEKNFEYVLPAIFADKVLEKFFGKTRQRNGGNFYIDVVDVLSAAKVTNLHTLLNYGIMPEKNVKSTGCKACEESINDDDVELIHDVTLNETQSLLSSDETLKHKVVYIAGHLVHKFGELEVDTEDEISSEFLDVLNRGGLNMPALSTVHFVYSGTSLIEKLPLERRRCRTYLVKLCDHAREVGCLRRKEKLST